MNLITALLSSLLTEKTIQSLVYMGEKGITPDLISDVHEKGSLQFIIDHAKRYGVIPTHAQVRTEFPALLLQPSTGPSAFFVDQLRELKVRRDLERMLTSIDQLLRSNTPAEKVVEKLQEGMYKLRKKGIGGAKAVAMTSLIQDVDIHYEKMKAGEKGIETPWPTVNESTLGFWPQDLILFAARTGIGKTWLLLLLLNHAWHVCGKRVLIASTEMSQIKMVQRWVALHLKLPYQLFRKGKLSPADEFRFKAEVARRKRLMDQAAETAAVEVDEGLYIVGGRFNFSIEGLELAIEECKPDILLVDGAYLIKAPGASRSDQAASVFNNLKYLAIEKQIPIVATTQFNRNAKKESPETMELENIALSDVAGWNGDQICGLVQTQEMKDTGRMLLKWLKSREGPPIDVMVNWKIDDCDFSEIRVEEGVSFDGVPPENAAYGAEELIPF